MQQANEFVIAMVKSTIARELEDLEPDPGQRLGLMAIIAIGLFSDLRRGSRGARLRRGRQQPACSVRPRVAVALSRVIRPPALPAIASRCVPRCRPLRPTHPTAASLLSIPPNSNNSMMHVKRRHVRRSPVQFSSSFRRR